MVGGEFVLNPLMAFSQRRGQFSSYGENFHDFYRYYTFGAYYSLKAILSNLNLSASEAVLLPSYLCPSILQPFQETRSKYIFYKLKEGLLPDLEDIALKLNSSVRAVLFIDYFGISYTQYLKPIMDVLRAKRIQVIQDSVQAWFRARSDIYGDILFNSIRKYSPFEASLILSKQPLRIRYRHHYKRAFVVRKRIAQVIRYLHIEYDLFNPRSFLTGLEYFNDRYYHDGILPLPSTNRYLLDKINFDSWAERRISNYKTLKRIVKNPTLSLDLSSSDVPLGLSIQVSDRDRKKNILHTNNIHCPVHWVLSREINKTEFEYCWETSEHELTLPVFVDSRDMPYYIKKLGEVI
jgi:hypothetical protein